MHPEELVGKESVLVDGTICPTWDWSAVRHTGPQTARH
jgi:hypothetical protein